MNHFLWDNKCDQNGEKLYHCDPRSGKHIFCVFIIFAAVRDEVSFWRTGSFWQVLSISEWHEENLPQKDCDQSILNPFNRWLNRGGDLLRNKYFFFSIPEGDLKEDTVYFKSNSLADGDSNTKNTISHVMSPEGIWGAMPNNLVPRQCAEEIDRNVAGQQESNRISD